MALPRTQGIEYDLTHHGDSFFIRTNDGAKTFRVVEAPVADPLAKPIGKRSCRRGRKSPSKASARSPDYLVIEERERGLAQDPHPQLSRPAQTHYIEFPEPVYSVELAANAEYDTKLLRFTYTSLVTPASVFDYNMETRERELKKQQEVLGGYDPAQYQSERIYATAPDGVKVPISLVYKKGMVRDGACADAALRLWILRHQHGSGVQLGPAEPARSRIGLRHRAHSRRRRSGQAVA